jgi:hypothetical protein
MTSSSLSSCDFRVGASKIAPHSVGLLAERNVLSFQFVEGHGSVSILASGKIETDILLRFYSCNALGPVDECQLIAKQ